MYKTGELCTGTQYQPVGCPQYSGLTQYISISADFDENAAKDKLLHITVLFGERRISCYRELCQCHF